MTIYDELVARGLIAQVTNEEEIKNMISSKKYIKGVSRGESFYL